MTLGVGALVISLCSLVTMDLIGLFSSAILVLVIKTS